MNEIKSLETLINERADQEFMHKYINDIHNFSETAHILFGRDMPAQLQSILESLQKAQEEPNNPDPIAQAIHLLRMKNRERCKMNFVYSIPKI